MNHPYVHSYKGKILVATITSIWLFLFLVFIAPFDASDLSFATRAIIMIIYSVILFICFMVTGIIEQLIYARKGRWSLTNELLSYLIVYLLALFPITMYYKSDVVQGDYTVFHFITLQYVPVIIIITPVLYFLRIYVSKRIKSENYFTIRGENKYDILKVTSENLIAVSSSDNYVEVNYLSEGKATKKLIRTPLKNVEAQLPFIKRVHRSHLANTRHFTEWKTKEIAVFAGIEIPVSKQYKNNIED